MKIAVLIPCYNEEVSIAQVVTDFKHQLPSATIYVYDNNSKDRTAQRASASGAIVRQENRQGKGAVVCRMFADIDADIYLLVDGDNTYDATVAPSLVDLLIKNNLDMVTSSRQSQEITAYRSGHRLGNLLFSQSVALLFGRSFEDIFTGYRVFSRRFVKTFPAISGGFEIETQLTVHALMLKMPVAERPSSYISREAGSTSKLNTYSDGFRIAFKILTLVIEEKPFLMFGILFVLLAGLSLSLATPLLLTFSETGLVPQFPTAILVTGIMILAFISLTLGLILDAFTKLKKEQRRLAYLNFAPPNTKN